MKKAKAKPTVAILATLDTKGSEVAFLKERLGEAGVNVLVIDGGILGGATSPADIPASALARKAGSSLAALRRLGHEGKAMGTMVVPGFELGGTLEPGYDFIITGADKGILRGGMENQARRLLEAAQESGRR
jgi:hypothetical protein